MEMLYIYKEKGEAVFTTSLVYSAPVILRIG